GQLADGGDLRRLALRPRRQRRGGLARVRRRWRNGALVAPAAHQRTVLGALAGNHGEGIGRAAEPALQRGPDLLRRQRGHLFERTLVVLRIASIEPALGERGALAVEPAHLLERADLLRDHL